MQGLAYKLIQCGLSDTIVDIVQGEPRFIYSIQNQIEDIHMTQNAAKSLPESV